MAHWIALDPGSATLRLRTETETLCLPAVEILRRSSYSLYAYGDEALPLLGRLPADYQTVFPFHGGRIADYDGGLLLLRAVFAKLGVLRPHVALAAATDLREEERAALCDLLRDAGAGSVKPVPTPVALALGADDAPADAIRTGTRLYLDVGAVTAQASVFSAGRLLTAPRADCAGDAFDRALSDGVAKARQVRLQLREARRIKERYAASGATAALTAVGCTCACPATTDGDRTPLSPGEGTAGIIARIEIAPTDLRGALQVPIARLAALVQEAVDTLSSVQKEEIARGGVRLCGGSARFPGLDGALSARLGLPVLTVPEPENCALRGLDKAVREKLL